MKTILILLLMFICNTTYGQTFPKKTGAWYMYFWNTKFNDSQFGLQGDIQYRNWNILGDLEQMLLRGGLYFTPKNTKIKITLGYGHVFSGKYGISEEVSQEGRIYQEILMPQKIGQRVYLKHRFRYEQRFVENQKFRTRFRYNLFVTIPFNKKELVKGAVYLSVYNELFINGERDIGNGNNVEIFDINRLYGAIGYCVTNKLKFQAGYMQQMKNSFSKGQIQISCHQNF